MFEIGKKRMTDENQKQPSSETSRPDPGATTTRPAARGKRTGSGEAAVIGPSIHIDGDVRGDEDLIVQGEVNGTIQLASNSLTVGGEGKINANVHAHSIYVDGIVDGDLYGSDRVCIRKTAQVHGNITSPRVSLDEGARFKGAIEMDPEAVEAVLGKSRGSAKSAPAAPTKSDVGATPKSNGDGKFGTAKSQSGTPAAKSGAPAAKGGAPT